jgi:hypothetical protein
MGEVVRTLWIGRRMPGAQAACLRSFVRHGHGVEVFCYGPVMGMPREVVVRDAGEYLARERAEAYGPAAGKSEGSLALPSNVFRYALLKSEGGWWVDADVFCVRSFPEAEVVVAGERSRGGGERAASCVMRLPKGHALAGWCLERARGTGRAAARFGETGPELVAAGLAALGIEGALSPAWTYCPVDWWAYRGMDEAGVGAGVAALGASCRAVHLWNEMWRRDGYEIPWPGNEGSLLGQLSAVGAGG